MQHFRKWFYEADQIYNETEPNAMTLTTIEANTIPKSRIVLLKKYTWEGFIFFTNYKSNKAKAITLNPKVGISFYWKNSGRILYVKGKASKISDNESCNYFQSRPRGSQLGAWASQQSKVITSRTILESRLSKFENKFKNKDIPKPKYWGGFLIKPIEFQFDEKLDSLIYSQDNYNLNEDYTWSKDTITYINTP